MGLGVRVRVRVRVGVRVRVRVRIRDTYRLSAFDSTEIDWKDKSS